MPSIFPKNSWQEPENNTSIIVIILGIDEFVVELLAGLLYLLCMCRAGGCLVALSIVALSIPYVY